ncbi:MAG: PHP domain-containing protein [archaeon]
MGTAVQEIQMKFDLHVHTKYSKDSILPLEVLRKITKKQGITPIITDHDTIEGNMKFGCKIIAEEIKTLQGEVVGLFMMEKIPGGLTLQETIDRLKQQDSIFYVPHPFDVHRKSSSIGEGIKKINPHAIEVFNPRTFSKENNLKALRYAEENNILKIVGSDAHTRFEIGKTYLEMEDFYSKKEFLQNLKKAKFVTKPAPIWVHALSKTSRQFRKARASLLLP